MDDSQTTYIWRQLHDKISHKKIIKKIQHPHMIDSSCALLWQVMTLTIRSDTWINTIHMKKAQESSLTPFDRLFASFFLLAQWEETNRNGLHSIEINWQAALLPNDAKWKICWSQSQHIVVLQSGKKPTHVCCGRRIVTPELCVLSVFLHPSSLHKDSIKIDAFGAQFFYMTANR